MKTKNLIETTLNTAINEIGIKETEIIVNEFLKAKNSVQNIACLDCGEELFFKSSIPQVLACDGCSSHYIFFSGRCRSLRKTGPDHFKEIYLRYFSHFENEKIFQMNADSFSIKNIDLKSRDIFSLIFKIEDLNDDTFIFSKAALLNKTTRMTYNMNRVRIFNLKEQLPEAYSN